ncbi:MAG: hypothetical protein NC206_09550 [Bacteroides sp.]|nr:hypothetical protein [Roseburia sp.]MCM1347313.1 hypothetical protein [Bacteroides sp.]MCM1421794.1 hypothetical protein [Bacteroides sp.]
MNILGKSYIALMALAAVCGNASADDIIIENGNWRLTYTEQNQSFKLNYRKADGSYRPVIIASKPEAAYEYANGQAQTVNSSSFAEIEYTSTEIEDEQGQGTCHTFAFKKANNGDNITMSQSFRFYTNHPYLVTELSLSDNERILSNYLAPIVTSSEYTMFVNNSNNRMLKVPFDNDGFGRYDRYKINTSMTSYEVSAIYEGESRNGLILGSIDHNHWKSAVKVSGSSNGKIKSLNLFSGVSDNGTRDEIPHGKLEGTDISSARMFIGFYEDWRTGMEEYARANTLVVPKHDTWTAGTPFGWQSWGVLAEKNSYDTDIEISDYYHDVLQPGGFCNSKGNVIFSLDASDGMNQTEHLNFIKHANSNGQMVGGYSTPFALWWQESELDNYIYTGTNGTKYTMRDVVLHVNGKPYQYDGAFCRDPTHPSTKSDINNFLRSMATYGYKYVKVDFTNCGIIQADSYYNKEVKTAVEAYNEGMAYFIKQADKYGIFVALSIAPLFPYQYANSRRIACDTWGRIDQTEYSMNAISCGWWTDGLYQYNDPDHLVLVGKGDQLWSSEGENRARYTNGAITGMMLVADNYSLSDKTGRGSAELSRIRAEKIMLNKEINEMADLGRSFMPVYGYKEYNGNSNGAESFFMHHTDKYLYVAIINYTDNVMNGSIPLDLLDISASEIHEVKELWTGEMPEVSENGLSYSVPAKDACVYRFSKDTDTGIATPENAPAQGTTAQITVGANGRLTINSQNTMRQINIFNMQGQLVHTVTAAHSKDITIDSPVSPSAVIIEITYSNGVQQHYKVMM